MNRAETIDFLKHLDKSKARLLRGPAGIGKDSLVEEIRAELGYDNVVEIALTEFEPTDVIGMPYIERKDTWTKATYYAQPYWWPNSKSKTILFLNELDMASDQMFPIAMRLACKRMAGGLKLPDNVIIFAACNGDRYQRQPLDQALLRRFAVIDYAPTVSEWLSWANKNNLHKSVIEYIQQNPNALDTPAELIGKKNVVVPTRASWADLAKYIEGAAKNGFAINNLKKISEPFIGVPAAGDFATWVSTKVKKLDIYKVMNGEIDPKDTSLLMAASIVGAISEEFSNCSEKQKENILNFYIAVGDEAFSALFASLPGSAAPTIKAHSKANETLLRIIGK